MLRSRYNKCHARRTFYDCELGQSPQILRAGNQQIHSLPISLILLIAWSSQALLIHYTTRY